MTALAPSAAPATQRIQVTYWDHNPDALITHGCITVEIESAPRSLGLIEQDEIEWAAAKKAASARIPETAEILEGLWLR